MSCWSFAVALAGSYSLDFLGRCKQALTGVGGVVVTLYMIGGLIKGWLYLQQAGALLTDSSIR